MRKPGEFAGHGVSTDGTWDSGCVYKYKGKLYTEADLVLAITKYFVAYSKGNRLNVVSDVPKNRINMIKQISLSNAKGCDIHIAIHCDYKLAPAGTIPLYKTSGGRKLAECLNKEVVKGMKMKTRGLCKRNDLAELNETDAIAVIFECGSIKKDLKKMKNAKAYGMCLAKGVCRYYGIPFKNRMA